LNNDKWLIVWGGRPHWRIFDTHTRSVVKAFEHAYFILFKRNRNYSMNKLEMLENSTVTCAYSVEINNLRKINYHPRGDYHENLWETGVDPNVGHGTSQ
jgi:hypothetical protein